LKLKSKNKIIMDLDKLKQDYANYLINTATIDQVKDLVTSSLTVVGCANVLKQQAHKAIEEMGDEQREELDKQLNPPKENLDGNPEE
jgi:predicted metal-binding transcription factor (methanogenesis marker protein 9)